ncbi:AAA domain protein [uncultured archaeon]|nr:AAA domain protein [uncultured archaeon]
MEKDRIIEVLDEWNFWNRDLECGFERPEYLERLERLSKAGQVVVVTGIRRSGKSTLLKQFIRKKIAGGTDRKSFLYVNFEEPRFIGELSLEFMLKIYDAYREVVKPSGKPEIYLDEVQNVPGWERFVRSLHEKGEAAIFVSGSSSKLLSREFGTTLTGRHIDLVVYPLSFTEFLSFNNMNPKSRLEALSNKVKITQYLRDYLSFGGFPKAVLSQEKTEILSSYFEDIIVRDVAERHGIAKIGKLRSLAKFYLSNIASKASYRRIVPFLGVSLDTVERFSEYLQESYLLFLTPKYAFSVREQEINPKKIYAIDSGLRNLVGFKFSEDLGKLYENIVFLELRKSGKEVFYHSGKKECDFITRERAKITKAVQVCLTITPENRDLEVGGLLEAMDTHKLKEGLVITEDREAEEKHGAKKVKFIPLWKWLLYGK